MRNMSFALTKPQMLARTKRVTRRLGWEFVKVGELLQPVEKCMGLKPGEHIVKIGPPIVVLDKWRERLEKICDAPSYGRQEVIDEGFPEMDPEEFVAMFCRTHRGCTPPQPITRIAFEFTEAP
jgi:hypothetical protein